MTARPSRLHASPADVDRWLRDRFAEDVLLRYQQAIGAAAVAEAANEVREEAADELHPAIRGAYKRTADYIDPAQRGGPYPSQLLCSKHGNGEFGPCPGAPWCTPRIDDVETGAGR